MENFSDILDIVLSGYPVWRYDWCDKNYIMIWHKNGFIKGVYKDGFINGAIKYTPTTEDILATDWCYSDKKIKGEK